jgi:O-antigen/teichoic acid export membrane protein
MQGLESTLSFPLAAAERTQRLALITGIAVILNIILNIVFIPTVGIFGAAVATTLAFGLRTGWLYHDVSELIDINLPISGLVNSGIATAVMAGILYTIPLTEGLIKLIVFPIVGAIVFTITFLVIGGPKKREIDRISEFINTKQ